jgi:hypothetical protein
MPQIGKQDLVPGRLVSLEGRDVGRVDDEEDQQEGVHDHQGNEDGVERRSEFGFSFILLISVRLIKHCYSCFDCSCIIENAFNKKQSFRYKVWYALQGVLKRLYLTVDF